MARWAKPKKLRSTEPPPQVRIGDRTYEIPTDYSLGDGRAIKRITGTERGLEDLIRDAVKQAARRNGGNFYDGLVTG